MALLGVAAIVAGGVIFNLTILILAVLMIWEWNGLCLAGATNTGVVLVSLVAMTTAVAAFKEPVIGLAVLALAIPVAWVFSRIFAGHPQWASLGIVYVSLPCVAAIWIRDSAPLGFETVLWLVAVVSATDIGAYFAGKIIGGPRLAPKISPKKTWAGLAGGALSAAMVGALVSVILGLAFPFLLAGIGAMLAVVAQCGDLLESSFKRRFNASDSSQLIPGHGGVLDRLDGFLVVLPVAAGARFLLSSGGYWPWR